MSTVNVCCAEPWFWQLSVTERFAVNAPDPLALMVTESALFPDALKTAAPRSSATVKSTVTVSRLWRPVWATKSKSNCLMY